MEHKFIDIYHKFTTAYLFRNESKQILISKHFLTRHEVKKKTSMNFRENTQYFKFFLVVNLTSLIIR